MRLRPLLILLQTLSDGNSMMQVQASSSDLRPQEAAPTPRDGLDGNDHQRPAARDPALQCDAPVDLVHLARHTLGNRDLEREILVLFQRQSACYVRRLKVADSREEQCAAAHIIKGSSRGIGAWRVASLADVVEAAFTEGHLDAGTLVDQLASAIEDANNYIGGLLAA